MHAFTQCLRTYCFPQGSQSYPVGFGRALVQIYKNKTMQKNLRIVKKKWPRHTSMMSGSAKLQIEDSLGDALFDIPLYGESIKRVVNHHSGLSTPWGKC